MRQYMSPVDFAVCSATNNPQEGMQALFHIYLAIRICDLDSSFSPGVACITETLPHIYDKFMTHLPRQHYPPRSMKH